MADGAADPLADTKPPHIAAHLGLDTYARLMMWAQAIAAEFLCDVVLFGSAVKGKGWHDLDVSLVFSESRYMAVSNALWGPSAWYMLCSALSIQATTVVGAPVEVHLSRREAPTGSYRLCGGLK